MLHMCIIMQLVNMYSYTAMYVYIFLTRHEKTGLMYTKYTPSHFSTYFTFCVSYMSSISRIKFPIVYSYAVLVAKVSLVNYGYAQSYKTSKPKRGSNFNIMCT